MCWHALGWHMGIHVAMRGDQQGLIWTVPNWVFFYLNPSPSPGVGYLPKCLPPYGFPTAPDGRRVLCPHMDCKQSELGGQLYYHTYCCQLC